MMQIKAHEHVLIRKPKICIQVMHFKSTLKIRSNAIACRLITLKTIIFNQAKTKITRKGELYALLHKVIATTYMNVT